MLSLQKQAETSMRFLLLAVLKHLSGKSQTTEVANHSSIRMMSTVRGQCGQETGAVEQWDMANARIDN